MAAGDTYQVRNLWTLFGQKCVNVFHYTQVGVDGTGSGRQALMDAYTLSEVSQYLLLSSPDAVFDVVGVKGVGAILSQEIVEPIGLGGTNSGDAMPPNMTLAVTFYTATKGPKGRGRTYLIGVPEDVVENGVVLEAYHSGVLLTWLNAQNDLLTDPGSGYTFRRSIWNPIDDVGHNIIFGDTNPRVRNLRSRTIGQGQ